MSDIYLFFVVVLFGLAVADLVVGVSNDAVNFLNSALGSKVATRNVIMIVASLGIVLGALFSSGMMEIARKGIFSPELFTFSDVMVVFAAVMIADIILLDLFNTLAMPTSTTVSIVFELLGAAVVIATINVVSSGAPLSDVAHYINSGRALVIISGIFLSVVIAFGVGVVSQYLSRLLFSFHFERRLRYFGGIWSGVAITSISYFLLIKGLKGASFVPPELIDWVTAHTVPVLVGTLVVSSVVMQILLLMKVNILRFVVLLGTFALAMAFASNDLVNFIGVPMAGLESYRVWTGTGADAGGFLMTALNQPVRTGSGFLLGAGAVMVGTLWLSAKAKSVTETEINLGRQGAGVERFSPNVMSRAIVRVARDMSRVLGSLISSRMRARMEANFVLPPTPTSPHDAPAFDAIRASVNLTVASTLIAFATSWKLPLSTTYVSFMVAMGSSLADRAWDRDTAVFRVAGVLNVIGGWFLTAAIAATAAGTFALIIYYTGALGVLALLGLAAFSIWRSTLVHKERESELSARGAVFHLESLSVERVVEQTTSLLSDALNEIYEVYALSLEAVIEEDAGKAKRARSRIETLRKSNEHLGRNLHRYVERIAEDELEGSRIYLEVYDHLADLLEAAGSVVEACRLHVINVHRPPSDSQIEMLRSLVEAVREYVDLLKARIETRRFDSIEVELRAENRLIDLIDARLDEVVAEIKAGSVRESHSTLMFRVLLDSRDVASVSARALRFYHRHLARPEVIPLEPRYAQGQ